MADERILTFPWEPENQIPVVVVRWRGASARVRLVDKPDLEIPVPVEWLA